MKMGADLSHWNPGVDYTTLSKHVSFVIPQEGYGERRNALFMTHVNGCKAAGIEIPGVYHFIYSVNADEARAEGEKAIQDVAEAGLPKETVIWCDFEYDTLDKAKERGITLTSAACNKIVAAFCETITAAGYPTGIYCNRDFYENWYSQELLTKYPLWFCDLSGKAKYPCQIWQYSHSGSLPGCPHQKVDLNYLMADVTAQVEDPEITDGEERTRENAISTLLAIAEAEVGYYEKASEYALESKTGNIGTANYTKYGRVMHEVQPSNMDYPAAWCDCFVDWCFYEAFGADLARKMLCGTFDDYTVNSAQMYIDAGRWTSKGSRGDQIFFKDGSGICHTGIVTGVVGQTVYTIEGNASNAVMRRQYDASDPYIAGYGMPKYELATTEQTECTDGACPVTLPDEPKAETKTEAKASAATNYTAVFPTVRYGSENKAVEVLQKILRGAGYVGTTDRLLGVDGEFGVNTQYAVKCYQHDAGLGVDGIVGPLTWASLLVG